MPVPRPDQRLPHRSGLAPARLEPTVDRVLVPRDETATRQGWDIGEVQGQSWTGDGLAMPLASWSAGVSLRVRVTPSPWQG
jgi:hypothetical protein